ncbi:MAG: hypothetical protein M1830_008071 [Pleopsidium flavum]|nr:MAG: hypothetical protein M1830_008071 [Pleopsidium flavum]
MSSSNSEAFSSVDFVAFDRAVEAIITFGKDVEASVAALRLPPSEDVTALLQSEWISLMSEVSPLVGSIRSTYQSCRELQSQLLEAKQGVEQQREQIHKNVSSQYFAGIADIRKELDAIYESKQKQIFDAQEQAFQSKLEKLEQQYLAKEAKLDAEHSRTTKMTLLTGRDLAVNKLSEAVKRLEQLGIQSDLDQRSPVDIDPFIDRALQRPPRRGLLDEDENIPFAEGKRRAGGSPEVTGGRALKKARSTFGVPTGALQRRPFESPQRRPTGSLQRRPSELSSDEEDSLRRSASTILGSPLNTVRDPRSPYELGGPSEARRLPEGLRHSDDDFGGMPDHAQGSIEGDTSPQRSTTALNVLPRFIYDKIQFPRDGSWTEGIDTWFRLLLRHKYLSEKLVEAATFKSADPKTLCFRNWMNSKRLPKWGKLESTTDKNQPCDVCSKLKAPACIYFLLCNGISGTTEYPTNDEGKRWKLCMRLP